MAYTEVTSQGWFSRIGDAFKGMLFGLVLFIGSFILLGWNENNYVERYKALKEGQGNTVSVASDSIDSGNEGKLIHTTGLADTKEELADASFKLSKIAIHLDRKVETYQYVERVETEKKKELGGSEKTVKTFYYDEKWSTAKHSSSEFGDPDARTNKVNPTVWKHQAQTVSADNVTLGAFTLSPSLIQSVKKSEKIVLTDDNRPDDTYKVADGMIYSGNPATPNIGDQRVTLSITPPTTISLVSQQKGNSFTPYITKNDRKLSELRIGEHTMEAMYNMAHDDRWCCVYYNLPGAPCSQTTACNPGVGASDLITNRVFLWNLWWSFIFFIFVVLDFILSMAVLRPAFEKEMLREQAKEARRDEQLLPDDDDVEMDDYQSSERQIRSKVRGGKFKYKAKGK